MPSEPLRRRHYYGDPRDTTLHPLTDQFGVQIYDTEIRDLPATYLETSINAGKYYEPLERAHNSGPHGWGIAGGLGVTARLNQPNIKVLAGVAIDAAGRHIVLAEGGKAEKGPDASNPAVSPLLADVLATGAEIPTVDANGVALNGAYYITIAWSETLDNALWMMSSQETPEMMHTPWLRFEPVANIPNDLADDGSRIILGRVQINAGAVTALTHERRRHVSLPAGNVQLRRGTSATTGAGPATTFAADNTRTGEIRARPSGGIEVRVAQPTDQIDFYRDDGTNLPKTINKMSFGADQVVARRADGLETVRIDSTHGNLALGATGMSGDLIVFDKNNRLVITLDGDDAALVVGAAGNEGDILVKDNAGQNSVRVDGNTGTTFTRRIGTATGNAVDVDTTFLRVHAIDLLLDGRSGTHRPFRALVDMNNRLVINYATDYQNGVDIKKLHLADHIRVGQVEGSDTSKRPTYNQWITLEEFDINLAWPEWDFTSACSVGMLDNGEVDNWWWGVLDRSTIDPNTGQIRIKWLINYFDRGDDWRPWVWTITWMAFRR